MNHATLRGSAVLALLVLVPGRAASQEVVENSHPVWAPDGRIYFHSDHDGDEDIYVMEMDGAEQRPFIAARGADRSIAWSPDGSTGVFMRRTGEDYDLYRTDADGAGVAPLVTRPGEDWDPVWSPDGKTVTWMATTEDGDHELYSLEVAGGEPRRVTDHPGMDAYADWDPGGGALVFIRRDGQNEIHEMSPDGSKIRNLTRHPAEDNGPRISPAGDRIAFFSDRDGDFEIYLMNRDGSVVSRLTRNESHDVYPSWSPDGRWLAFESDRTGAREILRIRPDGTGLRRLTDGRAAATPPDPAEGRDDKPNVAILVYDGVQVIDHAIPYEVFGQFSLNNVYTVAKEPGEITTYMGMRILPNHTFASAPDPDVLVLPGGDAGKVQGDLDVMQWVRRTAEAADHVLTVCTGTFFLVGTDLLDGSRVTTWFDRQDELRREAPGAEIVGDRIVVDSGKLVSAAGTGVEGALHVLAKLHGKAWSEVVRLNMEVEPVPPAAHVPRVELADLNLPDGLYGQFPWREAELARYEGDRGRWRMEWRYRSEAPIDSVAEAFSRALAREDDWTPGGEERSEDRWASRWTLEGRDGATWRGEVTLGSSDGLHDLAVSVRRSAEP